MANISSFHGTVTLGTQDKPWTVDGFKAALYILKAHEPNGDYGFYFNEGETMDQLLSKHYIDIINEEEIMFDIFGFGRWSFSGQLENFKTWVAKPGPDKNFQLAEDIHTKLLSELIKAMYDNGWYFDFTYYEEEGGAGFIGYYGTQIMGSGTDDFICHVTHAAEEDYNLYTYVHLFQGGDPDDFVHDIIDSYAKRFRIPRRDRHIFDEFMISEDVARSLSLSFAEDEDSSTVRAVHKKYKIHKNNI